MKTVIFYFDTGKLIDEFDFLIPMQDGYMVTLNGDEHEIVTSCLNLDKKQFEIYIQ